MEEANLRGLPIRMLSEVQPFLLIGSNQSHLITPTEPVWWGGPAAPATVHTLLGWTLQGPIMSTNLHGSNSGWTFNNHGSWILFAVGRDKGINTLPSFSVNIDSWNYNTWQELLDFTAQELCTNLAPGISPEAEDYCLILKWVQQESFSEYHKCLGTGKFIRPGSWLVMTTSFIILDRNDCLLK